MRGTFQPQFSEHKDHAYAYREILHSCCVLGRDGAGRSTLAAALLNTALDVMDYTDPLDFIRALDEEPERPRLIRLGNFFDYLMGYADKRYALMNEPDALLDRKLAQYKSGNAAARVPEEWQITGRELPPAGALAQDEVAGLVGEVADELLIHGVKRQMLARAFVDAAFVYAHLAGKSFYEQLCIQIHAHGEKLAVKEKKPVSAFVASAKPDIPRRSGDDPELQAAAERYGAYNISTAIH